MKTLFIFCCCLMALSVRAQHTVSGAVTDAESGFGLEGASVFAQNTSSGSVTGKEGRFTLNLSKGGYELIVSYTGYQTFRQNISTEDNNTELQIKLRKEDKSMEAVVITTSNEVADGWAKYGALFTQKFIGDTPLADSCTLLNPEALKFFYLKRSDKIRVTATEPLRIVNRGLGYNLLYTLDSFVYYNKSAISLYRGACLYQPIDGTEAELTRWNRNRAAAYQGSRLHFIRAYYDSAITAEGFTVDLLSATNKTKFDRLENPYDTAYYNVDSTGDAELWFPDKVSITYLKKAPERRYLQAMNLPLKVAVQISYVDLTDAVVLKENGYFTEQRSWINSGYWSWKNLADGLPYDYVPPGR